MKPKKLQEHPEGGRFEEVFRSKVSATFINHKVRNVITHIYFSLDPGEVSKLHKVMSDEVWNLYEGTQLELYIWDGESDKIELIKLSKSNREYCHVVPAGMWQAARAIDEKVLVGCSVAPGFEFEDFEIMHAKSEKAQLFKKNFPTLNDLY